MYYRSQPVSVHVLWIESPSKENLYLVIGRQRAILIDAGLGVGHLRAFVENLTSLPLTVLLTHGHIDHAPAQRSLARSISIAPTRHFIAASAVWLTARAT